jgi:MFS family permease
MIVQPHRRMYLAAFLLDSSVAIGLTAMPFLVFERLGGGAAFSGTIGAVQMALYAAGCLASAGFVARMAKNGLLWALAGVAAFAGFFSLVPWIGTPVLCGVVASLPFLGLSLAWPALQSWLGGEPDPEKRARHLTGFNTATAFGFTIGPLAAGPLYDLDYRVPFAALFGACVVVAALVVTLPREPSHEEQACAKGAGPKEERRTSPGAGLLYASWGATLTANSLFAAVRSVYPERVNALVSEGTLTFFGSFRPAWLGAVGPATAFSWLAFLLSLATVACFAILGKTRGWRGRFGFVAAGQLVAAGSFFFLGQTRSLAVMIACFALVGASFGLCFFASLYYSLADVQEKHRRAAINEGALGLGGLIGGIAVGHAAAGAGLAAAFQWTPLFVALAVAAQLVILRAGASSAEEGTAPALGGAEEDRT